MSRFLRVQTMKPKYAKKILQVFKKMISRKNTPEKFWLIKEQNMGELCKEKNIEVYSTKDETKAAFAERVVQSLRHINCFYIELS